MDINFELYKIFYHAAVNNSFSEAAAKLFITQSAVSQGIKNLETKLQVQLFFRKTRSLKLTPEGELLFRHIGQAYNFIKTAEAKLTEAQNLEYGTVRIGASDTICKYFLLPYLQQFTIAHPKIKVKVINRTSVQIIDTLKNGMIDFGIVTLPLADKHLITKEIIGVSDIFVTGNRFRYLQSKKPSLTELAELPLLLLEQTSATRRNLDQYLNQKGIAIKPEIELESVDLLVEFARIGLGIAHVQKESAQEFIKTGELFEIQLNEPLPLRKIGICQNENVPLSQAAERFITLLKVEDAGIQEPRERSQTSEFRIKERHERP